MTNRLPRKPRTMTQGYQASGSPVGCLSLIITVILVWALIFGVTLDGKHYGLDCSCAHGVTIQH